MEKQNTLYFASLVAGPTKDDPHIVDIKTILELQPNIYLLVTCEPLPNLVDTVKFSPAKAKEFCPYLKNPAFVENLLKGLINVGIMKGI